jgi:hypothetical protein
MLDINKSFDNLKTQIDLYIPTLIKSFLILIIFLVLANWVKDYLTGSIDKNINTSHTQNIIIASSYTKLNIA